MTILSRQGEMCHTSSARLIHQVISTTQYRTILLRHRTWEAMMTIWFGEITCRTMNRGLILEELRRWARTVLTMSNGTHSNTIEMMRIAFIQAPTFLFRLRRPVCMDFRKKTAISSWDGIDQGQPIRARQAGERPSSTRWITRTRPSMEMRVAYSWRDRLASHTLATSLWTRIWTEILQHVFRVRASSVEAIV